MGRESCNPEAGSQEGARRVCPLICPSFPVSSPFDFLPVPTSRGWNPATLSAHSPQSGADLFGGVSLFCPQRQSNTVRGPSHHANKRLRLLEGSQENRSLTTDCSQETDPKLNFHTLSLLTDDRKSFISVSCVNQSSD